MCPGTRIGGVKAAATNKERHGKDFYRQIGSIGGRATGYKGFAANPELARRAGSLGGSRSRRTGVTTGQGKKREYVKVDDRFINPTKTQTVVEPPVEPKQSFIKRIFGGK